MRFKQKISIAHKNIILAKIVVLSVLIILLLFFTAGEWTKNLQSAIATENVGGGSGANTDTPTICGATGCLTLQDGMTWVFLGDSITEAQLYSNYVESYFHLRYPHLKIHFRGEGRGGGTLAESIGGGRYDRRVYSWEPDVVSVMFGHNGSVTDATYYNELADLSDTYIIGKNGATPVYFSPHPKYDSDGKQILGDYTNKLVQLGNERGFVYADIWHYLQPIWSGNLASNTPVNLEHVDSVHPGPAGHIGIAYALLDQLSAEDEVSAAVLNASNGTVASSFYATISNVSVTAQGIDFKRLDARLPMAFDDQARIAIDLMPQILDQNKYMLTVNDLPAGNYDVYIDNVLSATVSSTELASGWNMTKMTKGPIYDQLKEVLGRIRDKEGVDRVGRGRIGPPWRGVENYKSAADSFYNKDGLRGNDLKNALQGRINTVAALDELIYTAADPVQRSFSLRNTGIDTTPDNTAPTLTQVTPVATPTSDTTPSYTFSSTEAGTITYGGSCSSSTTSAVSGSNTITFNTLANATYSNCTITVTDSSSNASTLLSVTSFTVNTIISDNTAPTLTQVTPVTTPTSDTTPSYTFSSTEAGTITYGGSCSSNTTSAVSGSNTITFNTLANGTYSNCTITVTDSSSNVSTLLSVTSFTVNTIISDTIAPIIKNLGLLSVTDTSATITWTTDEAATSAVAYGLTTSYGSTSTSPTLTTSHSITLSGLSSSTLYHFKVSSSDTSNNLSASNDYTFTTHIPESVSNSTSTWLANTISQALSASTFPMPPGIPAPKDWGMDPLRGAFPQPAEVWTNPNVAVDGNYYVDSTHPLSTDTNNFYGYPNKPRKTLLDGISINPGKMFYVAGGSYDSAGGDHVTLINGAGVEGNPAWFVAAPGVTLAGEYSFAGNYLIVDGVKIKGGTRKGASFSYGHSSAVQKLTANYVCFRNGEVKGGVQYYEGFGSAVVMKGFGPTQKSTNLIMFNTEVAYRGSVETVRAGIAEDDEHGLRPDQYTEHIWVLGSKIHNMGGDSIQPNGNNAIGDARNRYLYIGYNQFYHNGENAIDSKSARDMIVSSNLIYDFRPGAGSDGTALVAQAEGGSGTENSWFIFNEVYDSNVALRVEENTPGEGIFAIGNVFHDLVSTNQAIYSRTRGSKLTMVNNTISGFSSNAVAWDGQGSQAPTINLHGNIFSGKSGTGAYWFKGDNTTNSGSSNYNLYDSANPFRVKWNGGEYATLNSFQSVQDANSIQNAPGFFGDNVRPYALSVDSPAIDVNTEHPAYALFESLYGLDIRKDFYGNNRPLGSNWDIGAHEFNNGGTSIETRTLTISKTGSGTVYANEVTLSSSRSFPKGTQVTLTATPADGYTFTGWGGDCVGAGMCAVTMSNNRSVTATFTLDIIDDDVDKDGVKGSADKCPNTPSSLKNKINKDGCTKPKATKLTIKNDLDNEDLSRISHLEVEDSTKGKIKFNQPIDILNLVSTASTQMDLDTFITIEAKRVSVTSSSQFNKPATITLYNITEKNPVIKRDGVACNQTTTPKCIIMSFANRTLVFTVDGFSTYTIEEGVEPVVTAPPILTTAPGTPDMTDASDLGIFNTDNLTSNSQPQFMITCTSGNTVKLYRNTVEISNPLTPVPCLANTAFVTPTQTLAEGAHEITAKQISGTGTVSAASGILTVTIDTTAPVKPTSLAYSGVTETGVNLSWGASTDISGVSRYVIYRNGVQIGIPTSTSYTDSGLVDTTTYNYTVKAEDTAGNFSTISEVLSARTLSKPVSGESGGSNTGGGSTGSVGSITLVNGVCDPALKTLSTFTPTKTSLSGEKLCKTGTASSVSYDSSEREWNYTCRGTGSGKSSSCTVTLSLGSAPSCDLKPVKKLPFNSCKLNDSSFLNFHKYLSCLGVATAKSTCAAAGCGQDATRQDLTAMAVRVREIPLESGYKCQKKHTDTINRTSPWVCEVVEKAQVAGLISVTNRQFRPLDTLTRSEAYSILLKSACIHPKTTSQNWQTEVTKTAKQYGFTTRSVSSFEPNKSILRQELFVLTARIAEWKEKNPTSCGELPEELVCKV